MFLQVATVIMMMLQYHKTNHDVSVSESQKQLLWFCKLQKHLQWFRKLRKCLWWFHICKSTDSMSCESYCRGNVSYLSNHDDSTSHEGTRNTMGHESDSDGTESKVHYCESQEWLQWNSKACKVITEYVFTNCRSDCDIHYNIASAIVLWTLPAILALQRANLKKWLHSMMQVAGVTARERRLLQQWQPLQKNINCNVTANEFEFNKTQLSTYFWLLDWKQGCPSPLYFFPSWKRWCYGSTQQQQQIVFVVVNFKCLEFYTHWWEFMNVFYLVPDIICHNGFCEYLPTFLQQT